jgi:hypothetical protein
MEPEVGIEPTTYRLQGGRYAHTTTSTCNYRHALGFHNNS